MRMAFAARALLSNLSLRYSLFLPTLALKTSLITQEPTTAPIFQQCVPLSRPVFPRLLVQHASNLPQSHELLQLCPTLLLSAIVYVASCVRLSSCCVYILIVAGTFAMSATCCTTYPRCLSFIFLYCKASGDHHLLITSWSQHLHPLYVHRSSEKADAYLLMNLTRKRKFHPCHSVIPQ